MTSVGMTEKEARALLSDDLTKVLEWSNDTSLQAQEPPAGSPLAVDDQAWTYFPLSSALSACHLQALDHLRAVRALVKANSWHPTATFSLTRSALTAAVQGVYLTHESEPRTRQLRGLAYADEGLRQQLNHQREMWKRPGMLRDNLAFLRVHALLRRRGIEFNQELLCASGQECRWPKTTPLMRDVAPVVLTDPEAQAHAVSHWMVTSSDAHGLHWGAMARKFEQLDPSTQVAPAGVQRIELAGDERSTALYVHMACLFLSWSIRRTRELMTVGREPSAPTAVRTGAG